jgi:asparagine synthase (glutamine-hydrolysing)
MCGIFGYYDVQQNPLEEHVLQRMGELLHHRGPDGHGCFHDPSIGVALGNQRLAIIDVEHGQQPFYSDDKQIIVVQNGEIFNHVELAEELERDGFVCNTHSDTESILRLYERDGIDGVSKLNGMFAIAIYDKSEDALYLIRDRVGEKPLYFTNENGRMIFASEIKSILAATGNRELNERALNQFLSFNYVPQPLTMFRHVYHVKPGHWMKFTRERVEEFCWWDLVNIEVQTKAEDIWIEEFNAILDDAVRIRLRADVPFGAFLSGGVDSSSVVGVMSKHLQQPVNTFCIGFDDPKFDESPFAQEAAERFHTKHVMEKVEPHFIGW